MYEDVLLHRNVKEVPTRQSAKELSRVQRETQVNNEPSETTVDLVEKRNVQTSVPIRSGRKAIIL